MAINVIDGDESITLSVMTVQKVYNKYAISK